MNPAGLNREECVRALRAYQARIETLSATINRGEDEIAKALLAELDHDVLEDIELRDKMALHGQLSIVEEAAFQPAIVALLSDLDELHQANPGLEWIFKLTAARGNIDQFIGDLTTS